MEPEEDPELIMDLGYARVTAISTDPTRCTKTFRGGRRNSSCYRESEAYGRLYSAWQNQRISNRQLGLPTPWPSQVVKPFEISPGNLTLELERIYGTVLSAVDHLKQSKYQRILWMLDLFKALVFIHSAGLTHCNINPKSLIVREDTSLTLHGNTF